MDLNVDVPIKYTLIFMHPTIFFCHTIHFEQEEPRLRNFSFGTKKLFFRKRRKAFFNAAVPLGFRCLFDG